MILLICNLRTLAPLTTSSTYHQVGLYPARFDGLRGDPHFIFQPEAGKPAPPVEPGCSGTYGGRRTPTGRPRFPSLAIGPLRPAPGWAAHSMASPPVLNLPVVFHVVHTAADIAAVGLPRAPHLFGVNS